MKNIEVSVPQGSCLVQLLALACINDLPCIIRNSNISVYADDTSIHHCSTNITQLNKALNEDLERIDIWLKGNKLSLIVRKARSMLIITKQRKKCLDASDHAL